LQHIVNGGKCGCEGIHAYINREYGLGRKRTDLFIEWPLDEKQGIHGPLQRIVIEIKLRRADSGAMETIIAKGLEQTADYSRHVGADESHLVVFDRDPARTWDERIWRRSDTFDGNTITVWGV
jgi:hypothetical protein